jgi:hypothetical protein
MLEETMREGLSNVVREGNMCWGRGGTPEHAECYDGMMAPLCK